MYIKNFLNAGEFFVPVPMGLHVTVEYDENGKLYKIYRGEQFYGCEPLKNVIRKWSDSQITPWHISITGGTTRINGVLYSGKIYTKCKGIVPDCYEKELIKDFNEDPSQFKFYAYSIWSGAFTFSGAAGMRQWLNMNGFTFLRGMLCPAYSSDLDVISLIQSNFDFQFPLIMGYSTYRNGSYQYTSTQLCQYTTKKISDRYDTNGYVHSDILLSDNSSMSISYAKRVKWNMVEDKNFLITDMYGCIIYSNSESTNNMDLSYSCPVCGKVYPIDIEGDYVVCPDDNCKSRLYSKIQQMCSVLNIPTIEYEVVQENLDNISTLGDVLDLPFYEGYNISTTCADLLTCCVPFTVVASNSIFVKLSNRCNNSMNSIMYYIQHPEKISFDLDIENDIWLCKLVDWLADSENIMTIKSIVESPKISIVKSVKKFEGAPIFRGKKICITGKFSHGSASEICSILCSYSAEVVTEYEHDCDCLIVGDTMEDIDGKTVNMFKKDRAPVFTEHDFFNEYEIDKDLAENLV